MSSGTRLTAVAGGIGTGKSVISGTLRAMGYQVYDCDSRAKAIMESSDEIRHRIAAEVSADAVDETGAVNRKRLSEIVFADDEALKRLNSIVHKAVLDDIERWRLALDSEIGRAWVESAIIYESGIDQIVDCVWQVEAPVELRIERVMRRNGLPAEAVRQRIEAQSVPHGKSLHKNVHQIINDGVEPVLPQLLALLERGK